MLLCVSSLVGTLAVRSDRLGRVIRIDFMLLLAFKKAKSAKVVHPLGTRNSADLDSNAAAAHVDT